jgi:hypothetical protein
MQQPCDHIGRDLIMSPQCLYSSIDLASDGCIKNVSVLSYHITLFSGIAD